MTPKDPNAPVPVTLQGTSRPAGGLSRRQTLQWVLGAVAASALPTPSGNSTSAAEPMTLPAGPEQTSRRLNLQERATTQPGANPPGGYGTDPNLTKIYKPGDVWPLTFDAAQRTAAKALADTILPADAHGPAASTVGVVEMIDEWVSAPYPSQKGDRPVILDGLAWIDAEANKRFGKAFAGLDQAQRHAICDDVCHPPAAKKEFGKAASFFARFRGLCAGAYYATPEGWKAIGYEGNVALDKFDGPPAEVLAKLGVTQTVA